MKRGKVFKDSLFLLVNFRSRRRLRLPTLSGRIGPGPRSSTRWLGVPSEVKSPKHLVKPFLEKLMFTRRWKLVNWDRKY